MSAAIALWLALAAAPPAQSREDGWRYVPPAAEHDAKAAAEIRNHDGLFIRQGLGVTYLHSRGRADVPNASGDNFFGSPGTPGQTRLRAVSGPGVVAYAAIGATPVAGMVFAFELASHMFWDLDVQTEDQPRVTPVFTSVNNRSAKYLSYGLLALWYPDPKRGFNVGMSIALASAHENGPSGWWLGPELGYQWWIGEQWSLGAVLKASFAGFSSDGERSFFEQPFVGGDNAYVAMPSLAAVLTFH
jgi:hypothetical protein